MSSNREGPRSSGAGSTQAVAVDVCLLLRLHRFKVVDDHKVLCMARVPAAGRDAGGHCRILAPGGPGQGELPSREEEEYSLSATLGRRNRRGWRYLMLALLEARYPADSMKRAIEVFMSPEMPKRPDYCMCEKLARSHTRFTREFGRLFLLEIADEHLSHYVASQSERAVFMQSRIPGFEVEVHIGQSVPDPSPRH